MSHNGKARDPQQLNLRVFSSIPGGLTRQSFAVEGDNCKIDSIDKISQEEDRKIYQAIADRYFETKL